MLSEIPEQPADSIGGLRLTISLLLTWKCILNRMFALMLMPLLLVLAFAGTSVPGYVNAEDNLRQDAEFHGGKTFDEWIGQAKQGRRLEDRAETGISVTWPDMASKFGP
ncbi:hypothetical protein SH528x_000162 [Novipirellula sp. SH528]|uniref:hypothetical protein n=1 Tax=Novipirellula sp. SH528 TaxID=3454466 RepID=UPI003F9F56E4